MRPSMQIYLRIAIKLWFQASLVFSSLLLLWAIDKLGFSVHQFILGILVIYIAASLYTLRRFNKIHGALQYISVCMGLFLGIFCFQIDYDVVSNWIDASLVELNIQVYREEGSKDLLPVIEQDIPIITSQKKLDEMFFEDFFVSDYGDPLRIITSFKKYGLVMLDGDRAFRMHEGGNDAFFLRILSDDNVILFLNNDRRTINIAKVDGDELKTIKIIDAPYGLHHWGDVLDGILYQPNRSFISVPNKLSNAIGHKFAECQERAVNSDRIDFFDLETGQLTGSVDILNIIAGLEGDLDILRKSIVDCKDPLHFNDIQIIKTNEHASYFPDASVGDILVSFRNIHTVLLLDKNTFVVKWFVRGNANKAFIRQHSPRITDRGTIIVFDNLGSDEINGKSRVVEIDIATKKLVGFYEAQGDDFFESKVAGSVDMVGDRILVQEQRSTDDSLTSIFFLDCPDKYVSNACKKTTIFRSKHEISHGAILHSN